MYHDVWNYFRLFFSLFSDLRSLAGTAMINLLASLFMVQLLYVIGVGGVQVKQYTMDTCSIFSQIYLTETADGFSHIDTKQQS